MEVWVRSGSEREGVAFGPNITFINVIYIQVYFSDERMKVMYLPITDTSLLTSLFLYSNECKFCCCQY